MAPIEDDATSFFRPLAAFGGYVLLALAVAVLIIYDVLYKSYRALPPSQDTRSRASSRGRHLKWFALLALASLASTCYHMIRYFALSYRVWAHETADDVPLTFFGTGGMFGGGRSQTALAGWLKDTSLFREAWEIVIEHSRRCWWSQQIFLGAAAWAVFVGVEVKDE